MKTVTVAEMRELDSRTIKEDGVSGEVLMDRAGYGVARHVAKIIDGAGLGDKSVEIIAGGGNNAGDAFVVGCYLNEWGYGVALWLAKPSAELKGDSRIHYERMCATGIPVDEVLDAGQWEQMAKSHRCRGILVDGLLGTGSQGAPRGAIGAAVDYINAAADTARVVSIDLPSGLDADTGVAAGAAVHADLTVTMARPKAGLLMPEAVDYVGRLVVVDIGIPEEMLAGIESEVELIDTAAVVGILGRRRPRSAHKGNFGRVLVIGGAPGYSGAVTMAARAAMRSGAGLVNALVPDSIVPLVAGAAPEIMVNGAAGTSTGSIAHSCWDEWERKSTGFDAILIGPGLTRSESSLRLVRDMVRDVEVPLVVDADAIAVLEGGAHWFQKCRVPVVITPHPGEMALLMMKDVVDVQSARWEFAREAAAATGATVVLKGAGTCIAKSERPLQINMTGNPGMATAGSGDVLGGMIASLIAQKIDPYDAARAAVYLHGRAGDSVALGLSERGLIAGDLIDELPLVLGDMCGR